MRSDLPAGGVRFPCVAVELPFFHHLNAEILRPACVRLRKMRGALGYGAVGDQLHGPDADPFVAESGSDAGGEHAIEIAEVEQVIHPHA